MRIQNTTTGQIQINDMPGQQSSGLIIQGGATIDVFNEDAEKSLQLKSFIDDGLIVVLDQAIEPTSGTSVADASTAGAADATQALADAAAAQGDATQALTDASTADGKAVAAQSTADAAVPKANYANKGQLLLGSATPATPLALSPGANDEVLTADDTKASGMKWAAGGGGGGGGDATVLVDAPTGTDDNLKVDTALAALPAGGGRIVLREGNYVFSATSIVPAGKPVWIQGQGNGTKISQTSAFESSFTGSFTGPAAGNIPALRISDMLFAANSLGDYVGIGLSPNTGQTFSNIEVLWCSAKATSGAISNLTLFKSAGTGLFDGVRIEGNHLDDLAGQFDGIQVDGTSAARAKNVVITGNRMTEEVIRARFCDGLLISNNISRKVAANFSAITTTQNIGVAIIGNKMVGANTNSPIVSNSDSDILIVGNSSESTGQMILSDSQSAGSDKATVTGNRMAGGFKVDANFTGTDISFSGNDGAIQDDAGNANVGVVRKTFNLTALGTGSTTLIERIPLAAGEGIIMTLNCMVNEVSGGSDRWAAYTKTFTARNQAGSIDEDFGDAAILGDHAIAGQPDVGGVVANNLDLNFNAAGTFNVNISGWYEYRILAA